MADDGQEAGIGGRPRPPELLFSIESIVDHVSFAPAPDVEAWMFATFIDEGAPLENEEHQHLRAARIGVLWTSVANGRHGRRIVGQAEFGRPTAMGKWAKARAEQQVTEWFDCIPDFLITLDADYASTCGDAEFCALVEHELGHCGQDRDEFGMPRFKRDTGLPAYALRGHDVEEFAFIVRRYGADAAGVRALIDAAAEGPTVATASIASVCGTCQR